MAKRHGRDRIVEPIAENHNSLVLVFIFISLITNLLDSFLAKSRKSNLARISAKVIYFFVIPRGFPGGPKTNLATKPGKWNR